MNLAFCRGFFSLWLVRVVGGNRTWERERERRYYIAGGGEGSSLGGTG